MRLSPSQYGLRMTLTLDVKIICLQIGCRRSLYGCGLFTDRHCQVTQWDGPASDRRVDKLTTRRMPHVESDDDRTRHSEAGIPGTLSDKGYEVDTIVEHVEAMGAKAVIPPKRNHNLQREYDKNLCRQRTRIERCFSKLKCLRRFATRLLRNTGAGSRHAFAHRIARW